jgi:hypothetical protein
MSNSNSSSNDISTSCNSTSTNSISHITMPVKVGSTCLRLTDTNFLIEESPTGPSNAIMELNKKILFQIRLRSTYKTHEAVSIINRIQDINFIAVRQAKSGNQYEYMTVETFEKCYMPLVKRAIQQMDEKGYLIEDDSQNFISVQVTNTGPGPCIFLLSVVQKEHMEIDRRGNIIAFYTIGHPEEALSHLFTNIYSEIVALERAKKTDSLFIHPKKII